jgi:O-methyltransferase domain
MMDVLMMVLTGGRERTESEFRSLLHDAGFALTNITPTMGASILESRPI